MNPPRSLPGPHRAFLDRAVPLLAADERIAGIAATGSYADDAMDEFSDLDLVLACEPGHYSELIDTRVAIAGELGNLVAAFTGEHVGEPRVLICLYASPALHVDIKVLRLEDLPDRVDEPVVLWDRHGKMAAAYANKPGRYPLPDPQWIEDRFWVWIHYASLKIARGELQEAIDFLSYLRITVLGPLGVMQAGRKPAGVRRVESLPALAAQLARTIGALDRESLIGALRQAMALYLSVRPGSVSANRNAERVAMQFLDEVERMQR